MYVTTVSSDNTSKVWNVSSNTNWTLMRAYKNHTRKVHDLEYINEDTIATGSDDCTIHIWSISANQTLSKINAKFSVTSLKMLSNGYYLAAGLANGHINIYNITMEEGGYVKTLKGHISWITDLILVNPHLLASSCNDNTTRIWNLTTYTLIYNLTEHTDSVRGLKLISTDVLASGSWDYTIKLWNITSGILIRTLRNHTNYISCSIDLYNSEILVSGSADQTIKLWNWSSGECLNTIKTSLTIRALAVINSTFKSW
jgi:WD40 repeat protein